MQLELLYSPWRATRVFLIVLGALVAMHLLVAFCHLFLHWPVNALTILFDLDAENNAPTFYNCFLFFVGAFFFYLAWRIEERRPRWPWYLMAVVFVFLGFDEGAQVHEQFMLVTLRMMDWKFGEMGMLYYAWYIPYGLATLALALLLVRWLFRLDPRTRWGMVVGGVIYVTGAVFFESISGDIAESIGDVDLGMNGAYVTVVTFEETFEMLGLIICNHFVLERLARAQLELRFRPDTDR
ncbi:MAG: hypothetical protein H6595_07600 [Flavobacteriales bacterium]|nr:hypothetical protein [Flavobacteriales bacterium]MCB9167330.1 hypothetical protein [Flavobacteriales bacterium]